MSTMNNKELIDKIIANNGYFEDDIRVAMIVEYTNGWGGLCWGVTWTNESVDRQVRYMIESQFVKKPVLIWRAK